MATNTTNLSNLFNEIIVEAQYTATEGSVMRPLVRMYNVANAVGNVVQVPVYGLLTVEAGAEGSELTGSDLSSTVKTITMAEAAAMTLLTDDAVETIPSQNLAADIGRIIGEQMGEKYDLDSMAKFANFGTDIGSVGVPVELTADVFFQAAAHIRTNKGRGNMVGVFHPAALYNLKKEITATGSLGALSNVGNAALESGLVGQIAGVTIFESTAATVGGVFTLDALGGAMKRDVRLETERDASKRATEIVGSAVWGFEAIRPEFGVAVYTENTIN